MRLVLIDVGDAPPLPLSLAVGLVRAALRGALVGASVVFGSILVVGFALSLLSAILTGKPLPAPPPDAGIPSWLTFSFAFAAIAGGIALAGHEISRRSWRVPHYCLSMAKVSAALRRRRGFERFAVGLSRLWGLVWIAAAAFPFCASRLWPGISPRRLFEGWPEPWHSFAMTSLIIIYFAIALGFIAAGLGRLIGRSLGLRNVAAKLLHATPVAAGFVTLFAPLLLEPMIDMEFFRQLEPGWIVLSIVGGMIALMSAVFGVFLLVSRATGPLAQVLAQPTVEMVRRADWRAPILFLRSFHDDTRQIAATRKLDDDALLLKSISNLDDPVSFENELIDVVRPHGPVIAIGEPGTTPDWGAARSFIDGEGWRETVLEWMEEAQLIVMLAGYTHGLNWELENVIKRGHQAKTVLVFPPNDLYRDARWKWVAAAFRGTAVETAMQQTRSQDVIAMHQNSAGELVVFHSEHELLRNYQAALALALFASAA